MLTKILSEFPYSWDSHSHLNDKFVTFDDKNKRRMKNDSYLFISLVSKNVQRWNMKTSFLNRSLLQTPLCTVLLNGLLFSSSNATMFRKFVKKNIRFENMFDQFFTLIIYFKNYFFRLDFLKKVFPFNFPKVFWKVFQSKYFLLIVYDQFSVMFPRSFEILFL